MDNQEVQNWSDSIDESNNTNIALNLPDDGELGSIIQDGIRLWRRVLVVSGNTGGRWAYWKNLNPNLPLTNFEVVADKIFNCDAYHFAGMLANPYSPVPGKQQPMWILAAPRITQAPIIEYRQIRKPRIRYERSNEIYDAETGTSTYLSRYGIKDDSDDANLSQDEKGE